MNAQMVAEFERITLAQAYDLGAINFLNDLAYLKDKGRWEKEQQRQWQAKLKSKGHS
jgi:hypothetical protein